MNKHGQAIVVFVLIIPLLLMLGAFLVDNSYMAYKNNELKNVTKEIIVYHLKKKNMTEEEINNYYSDNGILIDSLNVNYENGISIEVKSSIDSYFGKIINLQEYKIKVSLRGFVENNKVIIEKR